MAQSRNRLLDALPPSAFAALAPHLETVDLKFGAVVAETGREIDCVYFPYRIHPVKAALRIWGRG